MDIYHRWLMRARAIIVPLLIINSFILPTLAVYAYTKETVNISAYGTIVHSVESRTLHATQITNLFPLTSEERKNLTRDYDLLITGNWNEQFFPELLEVNPNLKIFVRRNVPFIWDSGGGEIVTARNNGWILKDVNGNEVHFPEPYSQLKLADIGNETCREWISDIVKSWTDNANVEGLFGDTTAACVGPEFYNVNADPIDPRIGEVYDTHKWASDMLILVKQIREKTGKSYIANGAGMLCGSWPSGFWESREFAEPIVDEVDGVLLEGFIRWSGEPWRSVDLWKKDIEYLNLLHEKGKITLAWTDTRGNLPPGSTQEQIAMFGFATYLLGKSGDNSYFYARGYDEEFYNTTKIDLGYPFEEYHSLDGGPVHVRKFSKSLVLLNPSDNRFTISLEGSYKTLDGQIISEIELFAHTGIILIKFE